MKNKGQRKDVFLSLLGKTTLSNLLDQENANIKQKYEQEDMFAYSSQNRQPQLDV